MELIVPGSKTMTERQRRDVSIWLSCCLAIVALIVVVGGLTRLTESGLSIVEWKPVSGILPPSDDDAFQKEFDDYKTSPQFQKSFPGMTLAEFKHIYWLEYIHRLLGRICGAVFFLPLVYFAFARTLSPRQTLKLTAIFALGGVQGVIGWYMVQSGLINDPHVSPYRLALHLGTGFTLFGLILWQILNFTHPEHIPGGFELPPPPNYLKVFSCIVITVLFTQIILGAFMAGLHAGLTYNTFPLMDGQWIPEGLWAQDSWIKNMFEDITTVQFEHRMTAYLLAVIIPLFWLVGRNNSHVAHLLPILFSVFVLQFLFGVLTLLFIVPVPLASLHQANALLLFAIAVTLLHRLFIPLKSIAYDIRSKPSLA